MNDKRFLLGDHIHTLPYGNYRYQPPYKQTKTADFIEETSLRQNRLGMHSLKKCRPDRFAAYRMLPLTKSALKSNAPYAQAHEP